MKSKIKPPYSIRQGDVLLVDAAYRGGMPDGSVRLDPESRGVVLMHGEVTGHAHVLDKEKVAYFDVAAERYVQIIENLAPLTHEEHGSTPLDRAALVSPEDGRLQQAFQVEDFGAEVRRVAD